MAYESGYSTAIDSVYEDSPGSMYNEDNCYMPGPERYGGEYREVNSVIVDGGHRFGVSALYFDRQEELLWMGNQGGHVTSYYGPELAKYTSFQVHASEEVRDITTFEGGILALMPSTLRIQIRRGIPVYTHTSSNMIEMQTLLQWSPSNVLISGHQPNIIDFDLNTAQETQVFPVGENGCAILRGHNRFICGADPTGRVSLMDPVTMRVEHTVETHSGSLSDMDIHGNLLVTCGFSQRPSGLAVDRLLMVFDVRMMRLVSPIPVMVDPLLLRFLPSFSSRLAVVSPLAQMQLVDSAAFDEADICLYQMNSTSTPLSLDVSSSCQFISVGDGSGQIHLYGSSAANATYNSFSRDTEFADPVEPLPPIAIDDTTTPLPQLPYMPGVPLASDWPERFTKLAYRPTPPIDPEILSTMKIQGTIGYAPNPMKFRRNQVAYFQGKGSVKLKCNMGGRAGAADLSAVPKRYRWVDLRHTRGADADFEPFNKTSLCGLAATLPNNYCNVMLQILYYIEPVRRLALGHLCNKEFCLCCELAFLFDMMDKTKKAPCYANNFLRAFRTVPEASALGLILNDRSPEARKRLKLIRLIQDWNRFIIHQIHSDLLDHGKRKNSEKSSEGAPDDEQEESVISDLFGVRQLKINRCLKCSTDIKNKTTLFVANLTYPSGNNGKSFCSVLEQSLCPEQTTTAWCDKCDKFRPTSILKRLEALPHILAVNCGMDNVSDKAFLANQMGVATEDSKENVANNADPDVSSSKPCRYGSHCTRSNCRFFHSKDQSTDANTSGQRTPGNLAQTWLPTDIQLTLQSSGNVDVVRLNDNQQDAQKQNKEDEKDTRRYKLRGIIYEVSEPPDRRNLIAFIKVGQTYHQRCGMPTSSQWYLFNHFCVTPVSKQEVTWFSLQWKVPCVMYFVHNALPKRFLPPVVVNPITVDVFSGDKSIARNRAHNLLTFTPLGVNEMPEKDSIVAMDAEFVTLNQEETELRSDGRISTVKPSHMSVARITCIRGHGDLKGTPFMDDYISTQEQVFDYLTKFSGIQPGDLDANFSSKHLTTLKTSYLKLRFLVDSGVKFVGHGLKNDIRVINMCVPPEQLIDTVLLFHLPQERMISLRFLAWHFLGIKIQSHTHDSIEDARAALGLYTFYLQLVSRGTVSQTLRDLYELGHSLNWKVPDDDEGEPGVAAPEWENSDEEPQAGI